MRGMLTCHASRMPWMNPFGPPSSSTCGRNVWPRVNTLKFCRTMASNSEAISSCEGVPGLLQAVDIGFGKDAALAGNLMQLDAVVGLVGKLGSGDLEFGVDLVDDRARTAGALVVHRGDLLLAPGLFVILEDDDLRILPAQLDDRVHLGMELLDGERDGVHFLDEFGADHLGDRAAARSSDKDAGVLRADAGFGFHAAQKLETLFRLSCFVALVVLPDGFVRCGIHHDRLDRGGADVQTDQKSLHHTLP